MKTVKLSDLLIKAGYSPNDKELRIELDLRFTHLSFPNNPNVDYYGFGIHFPGFGVQDMEDDEGEPVYIEYRNADGEKFPNVAIWADINKPDAGVVSLEYADLSSRVPSGG